MDCIEFDITYRYEEVPNTWWNRLLAEWYKPYPRSRRKYVHYLTNDGWRVGRLVGASNAP